MCYNTVEVDSRDMMPANSRYLGVCFNALEVDKSSIHPADSRYLSICYNLYFTSN